MRGFARPPVLALGAVLMLALYALPAFAQEPIGPICCRRSPFECTEGECPFTSTFESGWRSLHNNTCDGGKTCKPLNLLGFTPAEADATSSTEVVREPSTLFFIPNLTIPGSIFQEGAQVTINGRTIGLYVSAFYTWFAGAAGVLAVFMVMFGGFRWVTAAGNPGRIGEAKETITGALVGLVLLLGSYVILNTISPSLVATPDLTSLSYIEPIVLEPSEHFSIGLIDNPAGTSLKDQHNNATCPNLTQMRTGFQGFITGYYRPTLDDAGGYGSVMCNIGMQCSCTRTAEKTCRASGYSKAWAPCNEAKLNKEKYCTKTASGETPVDRATVASSRCFGFGTELEIVGGNANARVLGRTWRVNDRGGDIKGTHFDLYTGTGTDAKDLARQLSGVVTIKIKHYCPVGQPDNCLTP